MSTKKLMLMLCVPDEKWEEGPVQVIGQFAAPVRRVNFDHAGVEYQRRLHEQLVRKYGSEEALRAFRSAGSGGSSSGGKAARKSKKKKGKGKAMDAEQLRSAAQEKVDREALAEARRAAIEASKLPKRDWSDFKEANVDLEDYYALLNLSDVNVRASPEEISSMYKRASLYVHPDKYPQDRRDVGEERFKAMQHAVEIFSDPVKRRQYDSTLPFDDSLPRSSSIQSDDDFFRIYSDVFARNSQFASVRREQVPLLGDMSTPMNVVHAFYDWWFAFQTWRTFKHDDEHDLDEAQTRDERRWMERQNAKLVASLRKAESMRIRKLAEGAFEKDPRIRKERAALDESKRLAKEARLAMRKRREDEKKQRKEAAKAAKQKEEKEKREKAAQERKKKTMAAQYQKRLCIACRSSKVKGEPYSEIDIALLTECVPFDRLEFLDELLEYADEDDEFGAASTYRQVRGVVDDAIEQARKKKEAANRKAQEELAHKRMLERKEKEERAKRAQWTMDEESALARAIAKVPGGTRGRWKIITDMVNMATQNSNRKQKEVIAKAKEFETRKQTKTTEHFAAYQKKLAVQRGVADAAKPKEVDPAALPLGVPAADAVSSQNGTTKRKRRKKGKRKDKGKCKNSQAQSPSDVGDVPSVDDAAWSADQQASLERALRTVPKGSDRWDKIAEAVVGKTKKQCVVRFKEIRAKIMKRKKQQQASA